MTHFDIKILTPNPIRCPVCSRDIRPCAFVVVDTLMFCPDCVRACTHAALGLEVDSAELSCLDRLYSTTHGVRFYTPPVDTPRDFTAAQVAAAQDDNQSPCAQAHLDRAAQRYPRPRTPVGQSPPPPTRHTRRTTPSAVDTHQLRLLDDSDQPNAARMVPESEE
jgi:hypothetical protein